MPPATPTAANGQWTLAMGDFVATDIGALTNWSITIDYTTPGGGGGPTLTYVWSPLAGLYTNATATTPYTGGNTPIVYAAPTALTVYTVRATDVASSPIQQCSYASLFIRKKTRSLAMPRPSYRVLVDSPDNIQFDISLTKNDRYGFKFELVGTDLNKVEEIENHNLNLSKSYGFTQNIIGMKFEDTIRGKKNVYTIIGFKTANRKYPILANDGVNNITYKFSASTVKKRLGGDQQINRLANLTKLCK